MPSEESLTLSLAAARRLNLVRQHLAGPPLRPTEAGVFRAVRDLGYVQLDPTSAVARMRHFATGDSPWPRRVRTWLEQNQALHRYILTTLRRRGPLASDEFEDRSQSPWRSTGWTAGRNVPRMLEFLAASGKIMVAGRRSGRRLWDLAGRVIPDWVPRRSLSDQEATRQRTLNALTSLGVATPAHLKTHYVGPRTKDLNAVLTRLQREGQIVPVRVVDEGAALPGTWWMRTGDLPLVPQVNTADGWMPRTTLLSPFENLIINRVRTEQLFDFHFRLEIYVPRAKRRHGYFVMPILHADRLIGRLDPVFDRTTRTLVVNALHLEPGFRIAPDSARALVGAVEDLARFLGASGIRYASRVPPTIRHRAR